MSHVYVAVRDDIPAEDQICQVGHACLAAGAAFSGAAECSIVVVHVAKLIGLLMLADELESKGARFKMFLEPDLNNTFTALATEPIFEEEKREIFQKHKLLKF